MIESLAHTYSEVFAPEYFVLLCAVAVILYEWVQTTRSSVRGLGIRIGVLALGWVVALVIYKVGPTLLDSPSTWVTDITGSLGLGVGILVIWLIWHLGGWGNLVSSFSLLLVAVTVPHLLITPFWALSSHVLYAATPAGYLTLVDRRFIPFPLIALGMVVSRPLAGAHTWLQSIGGLLVAVIFVSGFWYLRERSRHSDSAEENTGDNVKRV